MANLTIKDLPDRLHKELKKLAEREGRSLNAQLVRSLQDGLAMEERRRRLEANRRRLLAIVAEMPRIESSVELLREDRDSH
jgi:plasmid stability protein